MFKRKFVQAFLSTKLDKSGEKAARKNDVQADTEIFDSPRGPKILASSVSVTAEKESTSNYTEERKDQSSENETKRTDLNARFPVTPCKSKTTSRSRNKERENQDELVIQIIIGSYERVLHGILLCLKETCLSMDAAVPILSSASTCPTVLKADTAKLFVKSDAPNPPENFSLTFAQNFIFSAHAASIRCLSISTPSKVCNKTKQPRRYLVSGGADSRINIYQLSDASPVAKYRRPLPPILNRRNALPANPYNREVGSLFCHNSAINALQFVSRTKLISSSDDCNVVITRTRDWVPLSSVRAPIPKVVGRPSGDTAGPGDVPVGISSFALHPTGKLMITVSRNEKCMRLWNMVTGKRAGVLEFSKSMLSSVGESRCSKGEAQGVIWNAQGDEFVLIFQRGIVFMGMDSKPKARALPSPITKIHDFKYLPTPFEHILAVSTEDCRILFYSSRFLETSFSGSSLVHPLTSLMGFSPITAVKRTVSAESSQSASFANGHETSTKSAATLIPSSTESPPLCMTIFSIPCSLIRGIAPSRVKTFVMLSPDAQHPPFSRHFFLVAGRSDGLIMVFSLSLDALNHAQARFIDPSQVVMTNTVISSADVGDELSDSSTSLLQVPSSKVARCIGIYESGNRITCLDAYIMSNEGMHKTEHKFSEDGGDGENVESSASDFESGSESKSNESV